MMAIKKAGRKTRFVAMVLCLVMIIGSAIPVFAATPNTEKVEYEGKGTVEVEFYGKVTWKNPVVTVTDANGKTYKATIIKKDRDDISFRIKGYKEGTKYNFTISGVKQRGTSGYGKVKGSVNIPKPKAKVQKITQTTAKDKAIRCAAKNLGLKKSTVRDLDIEKDIFRGKVVWEISFEGKIAGKKGWYDFEYKMDASTNKVLNVEYERD